MNVVYIDPLELTHTPIKETFNENKVLAFERLGDFVKSFDLETVHEFRVVIIDIPVNIEENVEYVKTLIFLRALSEGKLKIVLFSDFRSIRFAFNKFILSPDLMIDKRTKLEEMHSQIKKLFKAGNGQSCLGQQELQRGPSLTYSEYLYLLDLMRGKSIKEISKTSKKSIKVLYTHRRNIFIKYNFKNMTALHSALTYE